MALLYVAVGIGIGLALGTVLGERSALEKQQKREMKALQDGFRTAFEHWSEHDRDSETVDEMWQATIEVKNDE